METERTYEKHSQPFEKGDQIYLFSDGFADQFGGLKNKKFLRKNFKSLLLDNSALSMQEQQVVLEKTFNEWKKFEEQTDDVLVIGIQL
jgi:serine phosphatase RsbU (regulator of sigma subunit)